MSAYHSIKVSLVDIPEGRLRHVDQDWADCLAGMFVETGQRTPIDVIASGKRFTIIAGAHRLTAARIAKWKEIDARVLRPQGQHAPEELRLHEVLENLARKDFNALERCEALFELKRIYEVLYPETKAGGDRTSQAAKNKRENQNAIVAPAFCHSAGESTGLSRRAIQLAVQIFTGLSPETRERLRGSVHAQKQSDLKALSELDATDQKKVLDLLFTDPPQATSIADARLLARGERRESDTEKRFRTVCDYLPNLPKHSRLGVFRLHKDEIVELVKQEGWLDA